VTPLAAYLRSLDPRLPRAVWLLQLGGLVNSFGNGVVLPFLIIYLHNVRGIPVAVATATAATNSGCALVSGFVAGSLSDRVGPRRVLAGSLLLMTVAISFFPFIHSAWQAFLLNGLLGSGSGSFWPSQSSMLAALAPQERRHAGFALQRVSMNLGVSLGGLTGGLIASTAHPRTFTVLFVLDACTFVAYAFVLMTLPRPEPIPHEHRGSYRQVARDRTFIGYVALNAVFMAAAMAALVELLPPFAKNQAHVSETGIGALWAVESIVIVVAQLPVAKLVEGRRRMHGLALMGIVWAASLFAFDAIGYWTTATGAAVLMAVVAAVFALGECLHGTIHAPLAADLAPPAYVGRYMALSSQSWQIGWIVGPLGGGYLLQYHPYLLWLVCGALCLVGAAWALALEHRLPARVRTTPRAEVAVVAEVG
jgi:MFS family permease